MAKRVDAAGGAGALHANEQLSLGEGWWDAQGWYDPRRLEETLVGKDGPLRDKSTGLELTHPSMTELIVDMALGESFRPQTVLDPAAGFGNFLYEVGYRRPSVKRLVGYETDSHAIATAQARLQPLEREGIVVQLREEDALHASIEREAFDLVVSNPPYVRIHRLGLSREQLRAKYQTAAGRFDIYFLFYELATAALRPGGRLAMITSNKFFTTVSGGKLRRFLRRHYVPLRIIDFRDASPFRAAVLPCVLVLEKGGAKSPASRAIELERIDDAGRAAPLLGLARDPIPPTIEVPRLGAPAVIARTSVASISGWNDSEDPWHFGGADSDSVRSLLERGHSRLESLFDRFSVGIKTTADGVFVSPFDQAGFDSGLVERELLHPLIRGRSVERWRVTWDPANGYDKYLLYPHTADSAGRTVPIDLARYPRAKGYLEAHRAKLEARSYVREAGRSWYEIWVPQTLSLMETPRKLVFPDFAIHNRFALDFAGRFVGASAGFAVPASTLEDDDLWYVLYMLNSPVYEYLHKRHFGTSILAKRYRYWIRHVRAYPMPWPVDGMRAELAAQARASARDGTEPPHHLTRALRAFHLSETEAQAVKLHIRGWLGDGYDYS